MTRWPAQRRRSAAGMEQVPSKTFFWCSASPGATAGFLKVNVLSFAPVEASKPLVPDLL